MSDYIYKLGNFNTDYITSVFVSEGYTDFTNCNAANLVGAEGEKVVQVRERTAIKANSKNRYDFAFIPDMAFLANPDPLLKNCELKLRFDRADAAVAVLKLQDGGSCTEIEIKDCYATTEYISSPDLRNYFDRIDTEPITYKFEDVEVLVKSIPYNQTTVRFDNLRGGNTPSHIFAGIIKTDALDGNTDFSSSIITSLEIASFSSFSFLAAFLSFSVISSLGSWSFPALVTSCIVKSIKLVSGISFV